MLSLLDQKKRLAQHLSQDSRVLARVLNALRDKQRRRILGALFLYEASNKGSPMPYTQLLRETRLSSNRLAFHLKVLRQAGLVQQLTSFPLKNASAKTGYRSFYQTTALALMVVEALCVPFKEIAES